MTLSLSAASFVGDELVVDVGHLELVTGMLADLGITHEPPATDAALGLARVPAIRDGDGDTLPLDDLLAMLRQRSAAERDGFVPTMGKNRDVDVVIGEGHKPMSLDALGHKPMAGDGEPRPLGPGDTVPAGSAPDAGAGIRIGMVDTTLDPVPDPDGAVSTYRCGHGTFVRSVIRQQAAGADVLAEDALGRTGRGGSWEVARAVLRLADAGVDIINLSLGCFTVAGGPPLLVSRAIERVGTRALVVAAAGNHGAQVHFARDRTRRSGCWPAAVPPVVAVGACDATGARPPWSPVLPWVAYEAPGVDVVGAFPAIEVAVNAGPTTFDDGHVVWSGTSFAAALVTGAVAARAARDGSTPRRALADLARERDLVRPSPGSA